MLNSPGSEMVLRLMAPSGGWQCATFAPLIPAQRPVTVLLDLQGCPTAIAHLDNVAGHREVVEPSRVFTVEVQAPVRSVGMALRRHRRVELVQVNAVDADSGGVIDRLAIPEAGVFWQSER